MGVVAFAPFAVRFTAYNPDQPRAPKGTPTGGQWADDDGSSDTSVAASVALAALDKLPKDEYDVESVDLAKVFPVHNVQDDESGYLDFQEAFGSGGAPVTLSAAEVGKLKAIQPSITKSHVEALIKSHAQWSKGENPAGESVVIVEAKNGRFISDGHHRAVAAKLLGAGLRATIIKAPKLSISRGGKLTGIEHYLRGLAYNPDQPRAPEGSPIGGQWVDASAFMDSLTRVSGALGSNPGGVFKDADGDRYYVKAYSNPDQGQSEHLANEVYSALGLSVPSTFTDERRIASKWLDISHTGADQSLTVEQADQFLDGFVADVLVGNWDAVGAVQDNVGVLEDGSVARLDQGGSFLFRARAGFKPEAALNSISEWSSFFDPAINPAYSAVARRAGVRKAEDLGSRLSAQFNKVRALAPTNDWRPFVDAHATNMKPEQRSRIARLLSTRASLIAERLGRALAYNPDQPRAPEGSPIGGQWIAEGASAEFPHSNDDLLDLHANSPVRKELGTTRRWFDHAHTVDDGPDGVHGDDYDEIAHGKLKNDAAYKLGQKLGEDFDANQLIALEEIIGIGFIGDPAHQHFPGFMLSKSYLDMWAASSGDENALAVLYQHAVEEELGIKGETSHLNSRGRLDDAKGAVEKELGISIESHGIDTEFVYETMRSHARAQYEATQEYLRAVGAPESITVARGFATSPEHANDIARVGRVALQPISSFSANLETAVDFAHGEGTSTGFSVRDGYIITAKVPRSRIFSIPRTGFGVLGEWEIVVLGSRDQDVRITKRMGAFKKSDPADAAYSDAYVGDDDDPAFVPFAAWSESDHPRVPAGESTGGQFTSDGGVSVEESEGEFGTNAVFTLPGDAGQLTLRLKYNAEAEAAAIEAEEEGDESARPPTGYAVVHYVKVATKGKGDGFKLYKAAFDYVKSKGMHGLASHADFRTPDGDRIWESMKRHGAKTAERRGWSTLKALTGLRAAKFNPDQPREPKGDPEGGQWTPVRGRARRGDEYRRGTEADRRRLGVPPAYTDLEVTDDPNADLIGTARNSKGKLISYYSEKWHESQAAKKWERITELQRDLPEMLQRVNRDIREKTEDRDVAMTVRLIAQTGLRNGGEAGKGVGASSLRMEHLTVSGDTVRLQFIGKGGVEQDHTVKDRAFATYVKERQNAGRKGSDRLFPHDASDTLEYQKRIGNGKYIVHDLRTHAATTLASKLTQAVMKDNAPTTRKEYKSALKSIATHVSKKLGNTPSIALSTYIHPAAVEPLRNKVKR